MGLWSRLPLGVKHDRNPARAVCYRSLPDHWFSATAVGMLGRGFDPMQQQRLVSGIRTAVEHVGAWVLDQPLTPALEGQCCDRLRPSPIHRELLRDLTQAGLVECGLVEWRWEQRQGRVQGWLWQNGLLQRFRWMRRTGQLVLCEQLRCTTALPLRALA